MSFWLGERVALTTEQSAAIEQTAIELVRSSNFNTIDHPDILRQTTTEVHGRYRRLVRGDHIVVTLAEPRAIPTAGGMTNVAEIVLGLREDGLVNGVFTIDHESRLRAHEKYGGGAAIALVAIMDEIKAASDEASGE